MRLQIPAWGKRKAPNHKAAPVRRLPAMPGRRAYRDSDRHRVCQKIFNWTVRYFFGFFLNSVRNSRSVCVLVLRLL